MTILGVLDRTGQLRALVERAARRLDDTAETVDLGRLADLGPDTPYVDVLVLGPREVGPAGLRRCDQWRRANPTSTVLAVVGPEGPPPAALRAAGIPVRVRGEATVGRLYAALNRAYDVLDAMAEELAAAALAAEETTDPEPDYSADEALSAYADAGGARADSQDEPGYDEPGYDEPGYDDGSDDSDDEAGSGYDADSGYDEAAGYDGSGYVNEPRYAPPPTYDSGYSPATTRPGGQPRGDRFVATPLPSPAANGNGSYPADDRSRLVTIASATGGCGKTFLATNLAALAAEAGRRVLLVDLDLQFGEIAAALRISHPYSVYDGLYDAGGRQLPEGSLEQHLDELVAHHELGFDVLTAPRDPALADYVGARDASRVIDAVLPAYELVIVDTPPSLNEVVLTALDRSDTVITLATLDVPSLKNLTVFLDTLRRLRLDDSALKLLLNKVEDDVGIDVRQAQEAFDNRFLAAIPQSRAVSRSINAGDVLVRYDPGNASSRALREGARACLPELLAGLQVTRGSGDTIWARLRAALRRTPSRS